MFVAEQVYRVPCGPWSFAKYMTPAAPLPNEVSLEVVQVVGRFAKVPKPSPVVPLNGEVGDD